MLGSPSAPFHSQGKDAMASSASHKLFRYQVSPDETVGLGFLGLVQ
jgi:hypothetical protein